MSCSKLGEGHACGEEGVCRLEKAVVALEKSLVASETGSGRTRGWYGGRGSVFGVIALGMSVSWLSSSWKRSVWGERWVRFVFVHGHGCVRDGGI